MSARRFVPMVLGWEVKTCDDMVSSAGGHVGKTVRPSTLKFEMQGSPSDMHAFAERFEALVAEHVAKGGAA